MSPLRRALLVVAVVVAVVGVLVAWHFFGPIALVSGAVGAAAGVAAQGRTVRGERRSAGRRHAEEVREVAQLQDRAEPPPSDPRPPSDRRRREEAAERANRRRSGS